MKLKESMNQAVTKVNDVGPVIFNVAKADAPHLSAFYSYLDCNPLPQPRIKYDLYTLQRSK